MERHVRIKYYFSTVSLQNETTRLFVFLESFVSDDDAEHFHHDDYDRGIHVHSDDHHHDGVHMTMMITTNLSFECFFSEIVVEVSLFVEFNYHLIANNFQF